MSAEELVKAAAALKFVELSAVPDASFAILVIVDPESVLVNVVAALPVACAVVKVMVPADNDPKDAPAVPKVAL